MAMRPSRLAAVIGALAVLFVGGFFVGAAFFREGPVLDAVRSPGESSGSEKAPEPPSCDPQPIRPSRNIAGRR